MLVFGGEEILQDLVPASQHEAFKESVQHVRAISHQLNIGRCAVDALPVADWTLKQISKLVLGAQVVWSDKVDHAPVLCEVVLKWVPSEDDTTSGHDILKCLGDVGVVVLDAVSFVTHHQVWTRMTQPMLDL